VDQHLTRIEAQKVSRKGIVPMAFKDNNQLARTLLIWDNHNWKWHSASSSLTAGGRALLRVEHLLSGPENPPGNVRPWKYVTYGTS
jgi:hypothetical protein